MHKSLKKLINGLDEGQFYRLLTAYFKDLYKTNKVLIINGPYDGGRVSIP